MRFSIHALGALVLVSASACDEEPKRPERPRLPPFPSSAPAPAGSAALKTIESALDAGPVEPPPAGGDLAADIAAFTTLDACIASHPVSDAVVGDALIALGYEQFTRDACRVLQAAKAKSVAPCREIAVSTLRQHCETLVAAVANDASMCPEEVGGRGREPTCLAIALRDARLCVADFEPRKTRCEAMILGNAKRCVTAGASRATCERDVARFRSILGDAKQRATNNVPTATFVLSPTDAGAPAASPEAIARGGGDLLASFGRGAVIYEEPSGARRIEFGTLPESAPIMPSYQPGLRMTIELPPFPDGGKPPPTGGVVRRADFQLPRGPAVSSPPAKLDLKITWKKLELERGGALEMEIEGIAGEGEESVRARVEVKSFVRDIVTGPAAAPRREPPVLSPLKRR